MVSMKKLSVSLLCLMTAQSALLFGMDENEGKVISGSVSIVGSSLYYPSLSESPLESYLNKKNLEEILGISLKDNDLLVEVRATNNECGNWADYYSKFMSLHPKWKKLKTLLGDKPGEKETLNLLEEVGEESSFPPFLPVKVFEKKNKEKEEGEKITLSVRGLPVELTCKQLKSRYSTTTEPFEEVLKKLKLRFFSEKNNFYAWYYKWFSSEVTSNCTIQ